VSHHHALTSAVLVREEKSVEQLLTTMENFTNPINQDSGDIFNLVVKVMISAGERQERPLRAKYHRTETP